VTLRITSHSLNITHANNSLCALCLYLSCRLKLELQEVHNTYTKVWELHEPPVKAAKVHTNSSNSSNSNGSNDNDDNNSDDMNDEMDDVSSDVSDDGDTPLSSTVANGHTLHTMPTPHSAVDQWNEHRVGGMFMARLPLTEADRAAISSTVACREVHIALAYLPCLNGVETSGKLTEWEGDAKIQCFIEGR
jgi:hypothetical protein